MMLQPEVFAMPLAPYNQTADTRVVGVINRQALACLEIAPDSDVGAVIVESRRGRYLVAPGAPLVGAPLEGPFTVELAAGMPKTLSGTAYTSYFTVANCGRAPLVKLLGHAATPAAFVQKLAAVEYSPASKSVGTAGYTEVARFPLVGRSAGIVTLISGSDAGQYSIEFARYESGTLGASGQDGYAIVETTGALPGSTLTSGNGTAAVGVSFEGEFYDYVTVYAKMTSVTRNVTCKARVW